MAARNEISGVVCQLEAESLMQMIWMRMDAEREKRQEQQRRENMQRQSREERRDVKFV